MTSENKIALTFDIDWAPEEVIEYSLKPLLTNKIPFTIFCTHKSDYINEILLKYNFVEASIHPNFIPILNANKSDSFKRIIDDIFNLYPNSIGARAHGHVVSSSILEYYSQIGLIYESGIYTPLASGITPIKYSDNFVRIPHIFQDDAHLIRCLSKNIQSFKLFNSGLKVFDFHPIHIFINTYSMNHYNESKVNYKNPKALINNRNNERAGIYNIYINLIKDIINNKYICSNMKSIAINYLKPTE